MISATLFEAKTTLSKLVKAAQQGETVIITSGREKKPVAQLTAVTPEAPKRLGFFAKEGWTIPDAFFDPLSDEELALWEGEGE